MRPIRDHKGLLGLIRACWEDLAPLPKALMIWLYGYMAYMIITITLDLPLNHPKALKRNPIIPFKGSLKVPRLSWLI